MPLLLTEYGYYTYNVVRQTLLEKHGRTLKRRFLRTPKCKSGCVG